MKILIYLLVIAVVVIFAARIGVFRGRTPSGLGALDGKLAPPKTGHTNSVSSQYQNQDYHSIAPLRYQGDAVQAMSRLALALGKIDGLSIVRNDGNYIYAQAQTKWMQYVDDLEFLVDTSDNSIHVRSASRLGSKDFGVNRDRVERIRRLFEQ